MLKKNKKRYFPNLFQKGFTYVEGILAITLTLTAATAIAFSVQKAINTYKSQELKNKALDALIQYTEDYRMMVAYGENPFPGKQPRGKMGHTVTLYDASLEKTKLSFGGGEAISYGYLIHNIQLVTQSPDNECDITLGDRKEYYNIRTWIEWDDIFDKRADKFANRKNLSFEVNQAIIMN